MLGLTILLCSILLGSMVFLVGIVIPSIHKVLDGGKALALTRNLFPRYCTWGLALSLLATLSSIVDGTYHYILLIVVFLGFLYSRQILLPKISSAKDKWLTSDSPQDKAHFKKLHKRSIIITSTQVILLIFIEVSTQVARIL